MADTLIGVERRTERVAGWVALLVVLATATVGEPWLQARGYGTVILAIYTGALPVLLWSLVEKLHRLED